MTISFAGEIAESKAYLASLERSLPDPDKRGKTMAELIHSEKYHAVKLQHERFDKEVENLTKEIERWRKKQKGGETPLYSLDLTKEQEKLLRQEKKFTTALKVTLLASITLWVMTALVRAAPLILLTAGVSMKIAAIVSLTSFAFLVPSFVTTSGYFSVKNRRKKIRRQSDLLTDPRFKEFAKEYIEGTGEKPFYLQPRHLMMPLPQKFYQRYRSAVKTLPKFPTI